MSRGGPRSSPQKRSSVLLITSADKFAGIFVGKFGEKFAANPKRILIPPFGGSNPPAPANNINVL
jgi:hypothetical protein